MTGTIATAYSEAASSWAEGPMLVYGPLAQELVARCPIELRGRSLLDLGAGTGAVSRAAGGAQIVAVDRAIGMLLDRRRSRPPATVGDALALPFRPRSFDVVIAAFSLNHLADQAAGMREAGRVARRYVLSSCYAGDDDHPVKGAVDAVLGDAGWSAPAWHRETTGARSTWTVERARDVCVAAGLIAEHVEHARIPLPDLTPRDLVRWRLGMAQCSAFVAAHDARALEARALERLGVPPPLVRSVIFTVARAR